MKKRPAVIIVVFCGYLALSLVGFAGNDDRTMQNVGPQAIGKVEKMEVKLDQEFTITLKSNPTTGYSWQIDTAPDENVARLIGSVFVGPQTRLVGAGGSEIWTFKAVGRGRTKVRLKYIRPWEKDVPPVAIAAYDIQVQ